MDIVLLSPQALNVSDSGNKNQDRTGVHVLRQVDSLNQSSDELVIKVFFGFEILQPHSQRLSVEIFVSGFAAMVHQQGSQSPGTSVSRRNAYKKK